MATGDALWTAMESSWLSSIVPSLRKMSNEPVHDFTGVMIFVIAFIALFSVERLLTYIENLQHASSYEPGGPSAGTEEVDA